jgi:hypothetical protein
MPTPITSKAEMYRRLNAGLLGPTLPAAETPEAAERMLRLPGPFAIRWKRAGGRTEFGLTAAEVRARLAGAAAGSWNLSGMVRDEERLCYGHLLDAPGGWSLHYSDSPRPCKLVPSVDGCVERWKSGLAARLYLRGLMDDVGWFTLRELVDAYPDHVVEFSVLASRAAAGGGPSNTVFWEVRCTTGEYERNSGWGL